MTDPPKKSLENLVNEYVFLLNQETAIKNQKKSNSTIRAAKELALSFNAELAEIDTAKDEILNTISLLGTPAELHGTKFPTARISKNTKRTVTILDPVELASEFVESGNAEFIKFNLTLARKLIKKNIVKTGAKITINEYIQIIRKSKNVDFTK